MERAKEEVLRYLGYRRQALEPELERDIEACMDEMRKTARPRQVWRLFPVESGEREIHLAGTALTLRGADIHRHLTCAEQAAVMAVTLGMAADKLIRRWERTDLTRSVILDACATQYTEELCDEAEQQVKGKAAELGLVTNFRYSPGYGDLELGVQPDILKVLDATRKIGLTCTESLILLPRKSVTAVVGLLPVGEKVVSGRSCDTCGLRDTCNFRRDGGPGGCQGLA